MRTAEQAKMIAYRVVASKFPSAQMGCVPNLVEKNKGILQDG